MTVKVRRFDPGSQRSRYSFYDVKVKPGMTVLDALFNIRDRLDDSLSFRYSCRGAVCGACAMLINKVPRLACRTQIKALTDDGRRTTDDGRIVLASYPAIAPDPHWKPREEVLIEPLPHLHVIRDLVVDMRKFFQFYRSIQPALKAEDTETRRRGDAENGRRTTDDGRRMETRMAPAVVKELEKYTNCILCGACHGACPVVAQNPNYIGPAALAKLYRFAIDPRENQNDSRLLMANQPNGWWACRFYNNCKKVCPKDVPPNFAIGSARQRLQEMGVGPRRTTDDGQRTTDDELKRDDGPPPWSGAFWTFQV